MARSSRKDTYERIKPEDVESRLADLDYAIFERLPEVGQKLGYHPMIKSVRKLRDELNEGLPPEARLSSGAVTVRLRMLRIGGLTEPVTTGFSDKPDGWQRTLRASELLAEMRRVEAEATAAARFRDEQAQAADWAPGPPVSAADAAEIMHADENEETN